MKKLICLFCLLFITGCQASALSGVDNVTDDLGEDVYEELSIPSEEIIDAPHFIELAPWVNPESTVEKAEYIVIATVEKINGYGNYSKIHDAYIFPYTNATVKVEKSFKGDLSIDDSLCVYKRGGTIKYEDYLKSLSEAQFSKIKQLGHLENVKEYIHQYVDGDVELEVGKTYLFCLIDETSYDGDVGAYECINFFYGTREVDLDTGLVLNNETQEWEEFNY